MHVIIDKKKGHLENNNLTNCYLRFLHKTTKLGINI